MGVSGQRHASAALYPQERIPGTHWIGGWVNFTGLNTEVGKKNPLPLLGIEPDRPVNSQDTVLTELAQLL
jgi:hypothetical protein